MKVGSIVELIDDNWHNYGFGNIKFPVKGKTYTVIGICHWPKGTGIHIQECQDIIGVYDHKTKILMGHYKTPFLMSRFRELMPPMSISISDILEATESLQKGI